MKPCQLRAYVIALLMPFALLLSGCSTAPDNQVESDSQTTNQSQASAVVEDEEDNDDVLESFNRAMWTFNWEYLDPYVLRPAAVGYSTYVPQPVRTGLKNMTDNLREPSNMVNNLLQGKFHDASASTVRFILNTTVGLLGFFDPASALGVEYKRETFGETLGVYGVGNGPFVMLPALGPTTVRQEAGDWVDRSYWPIDDLNTWWNLGRVVVNGLEARASLIEQEELINDSFDSYEFVKNAYFQNLDYQLHDGQPPVVIDEQEEADIEALLEEEFDEEFE